MHAVADAADFNDMQIPEVCFGGDVLLQRWTEGACEGESQRGKGQREGQEGESPEGGFAPTKRDPGQGPGEKRSGGEVRPTAGVDREVMFARVESRVGFVRSGADIVNGHIAEEEKSSRVGMSREGTGMCARQHVECGVFERVIAPGFEDEGEVEEHGEIIHPRDRNPFSLLPPKRSGVGQRKRVSGFQAVAVSGIALGEVASMKPRYMRIAPTSSLT